MTQDVVSYLQSKGLTLKPAGGNNVHTHCVYCKEPPEKRGRLYIETDEGLHTCFRCGEKGNLSTLRKFFGDPPLRDDDPHLDVIARSRVLSAAAEYYAERLSDREDVFEYLRYERGLTADTIIGHQLGWADGTLKKHLIGLGFNSKEIIATGLVDSSGRDFLRHHIAIPYHVTGNVVTIRGRDFGAGTGGKYLTPPGQAARLFNSDVTFRNDEITVCEGEFDCLVLEQLGYAAVGVPGANTWQDAWTGYLTDARRVWICFDNDPTGNAGAEKLAGIVGPKSRIVRMPEAGLGEKKNDISEWIIQKNHTKEDFNVLLKRATGGLLKTPGDAYSAWQEIQHQQGLKLGFDQIDNAIKPGLLPAQVMIILAKSGEGKSVSLINIFHQILVANPEAKILFVSLEQTEHEWFERARRIYRFYNLNESDLDCLEFYKDRFFIVDQNVVSEAQLRGCIEQFNFETGQNPDLVAVDYLGYWARSFKGEPYQRTTDAVMALKAIAKETRIPILTPHQVSRGSKYGEEPDIDTARDSGAVLETADFMLQLWSTDSRYGASVQERTGELRLKIGKSRHGGKGTEMKLRFARLSLAMVPFTDPIALRAKDEEFFAAEGADFELAIWRHRTGIRDLNISKWRLEDGSLMDPADVLKS